jgi:hypothetical protein
LNIRRVNDVKNREIRKDEPLLIELSALEFEMSIEKRKGN